MRYMLLIHGNETHERHTGRDRHEPGLRRL